MFTPPAGTWTAGQTWALAGLCTSSLLTVLGDGYTTMIGVQHGFVEGNPIMKFLFSKIGQSLSIFLSAVAVLGIGAVIAAHNLDAGYMYLGIVFAGEGIMVVRNYLKLKAAKISLS
jgi:hypothetical protein